MSTEESLICEICNSRDFIIKREATYLYTYDVNTSNIVESVIHTEEIPYLFYNREKVEENDFLVCKKCGERYSYSLDKVDSKIKLTILQRAVRADHQKTPEFLG